MTEQLHPSTRPNSNHETPQCDALRLLSRSPHPYHRQRAQLPRSSERLRADIPTSPLPLRSARSADDEGQRAARRVYLRGVGSGHSTESDSGTEADDEHFLKGLPAPKWRPHKGLRGSDGHTSRTPSPLLSPAILNESEKSIGYQKRGSKVLKLISGDTLVNAEKFRQRRGAEFRRRVIESTLLVIVGAIVVSNGNIRETLQNWRREISCQLIIAATLLILYPLRLLYYLAAGKSSERWPRITIPESFDPAPLLYPPILTMLVTLLLSAANSAAVLPNIILSLSSLPSELIPSELANPDGPNTVHWFISCIPLFTSSMYPNTINDTFSNSGAISAFYEPDWETMSLIYPLHEALCFTLRYLTSTSLLRAELQLLSIALINLLLLSSSPQAIILQALLWGGGVAFFIMCGRVLKWVITLARVPKWRFRRPGNSIRRPNFPNSKPGGQFPKLGGVTELLGVGNGTISDESDTNWAPVAAQCRQSDFKANLQNQKGITDNYAETTSTFIMMQRSDNKGSNSIIASPLAPTSPLRRHTLPSVSQPTIRSSKTTPSGRRKRSASSNLRSFFLLTEKEALIRKWVYAVYVYICIAVIALVGIRLYVGKYALASNEPIGWALGYLLGNIPWFRMQVMTANLERWICLPERNSVVELGSCHQGWVEHLRQATFGPANTRLILSMYWLGIIIVGLTIVFRLSAICEVDTRRKVFHFMMVAMFLPVIYVDPAFAAIALSLVLTIFLLLDLFRASQLPPLSRPLAHFLTPYVDGRDLRGPVVISHIFLLIGCAIPLWLSLGALPRSGRGPWSGWDLPTRDVSMVSGVICVGMGDSAASLIGRRFGRHKWFWGGGKSLEGSLAFAITVSSSLILAKAWLRIGGWPESWNPGGLDPAAITTTNALSSTNAGYNLWISTAWKAGIAAGVASLTEAVLTGGNDNVVVPIVLWLTVKGLRI